tara:strand:- start:688 stop:1020 length:333 start_codon:yes stop_codon:yes gene_type:complete
MTNTNNLNGKEQSVYDITSEQMEVRQFGKDMMDLAFIEKDDVRSNKLSDLGYRMSRFGDTWSIRAKDLTEEELQLVDYAQKEINAPKNRKKLKELKQRAKEKLEKAFTDE